MTTYRYFTDLPNGETIRFDRVDYRGKEGFFGWDAPSKAWVKITRKIEMKSMPTRHECDARCINATGRVMKCECSCGGRNHGKGTFTCEAVAA
jgi:hypothetical protein